MSCYHPRPTYQVVDNFTGEVSTHLWRPPAKGFFTCLKIFSTPCGQCVGCRHANTQSLAIRCEHESLFHKENCFLTLTVNDSHLEEVFPKGSLRYEPFQDFIRAFRKSLGTPIRFFMCGEYGSELSRPHYHAIIFGWFPDERDRLLYRKTDIGTLYVSKLVSRHWTFGFHTVGPFSKETAAYTAGYMQKKINGKLAAKWYQGRKPEFAKFSNRGCPSGLCPKPHGIGGCFYHKFKKDMFNYRDEVVLPGGRSTSIPRYYDKLHGLYHPAHMESVKARRCEPDPVRDAESTPERLAVREVIHKKRLGKSKRSLH